MLRYNMEVPYLCRVFFASLMFLGRNRLATASRGLLELLVKRSRSVRYACLAEKVRKDHRMLRYDLESSYLCRGFYAQLAFLEKNRLATASREVLALLV